MKSNFMVDVSAVELAPPQAAGTVHLLFQDRHRQALAFGATLQVETARQLRDLLDQALAGHSPIAN